MHRYADIYYGMVRTIVESEFDFQDFVKLYSPAIRWLDVTGLDCKEGYRLNLNVDGTVSFENTEEVFYGTEFDQLKAQKLELLEYNVERAINNSFLTSLGIDVDCNQTAYYNVCTLVDTMEDNESVEFCDAYNILHVLSKQDILTIKKEIAKNNVYIKSQKFKIRHNIENSETIEELKEIDCSIKTL